MKAFAFGLLVLGACGGDSTTPKDFSKVPLAASIVAGDAQADSIGATLASPVTVKVATADGAQPATGVVVNFVVTDVGCGKAFAGSAATDGAGRAADRWILGTKAGACTMEVRTVDADGTPHVLSTAKATVKPGAPVSAARSGLSVGAWIGDVLDISPAVRVTDRSGNVLVPVPTATFSSLPKGARQSSGPAQAVSDRETETISGQVAFGPGSALTVTSLRFGWYENLSSSKWHFSFACTGGVADSAVVDVRVTGVQYDAAAATFEPKGKLVTDGSRIVYKNGVATATAWPTTYFFQYAGSLQLGIQTGASSIDESTAGTSAEDRPTRYTGNAVCDASYAGGSVNGVGAKQKRPFVFEQVP